ncbi:SPOR domain-containing protein [Lacinutrix sp. C3R15]|uniref:SPOR domain-containing protein n=1 Tax=Flavobacteriaceae TaxID=49546 RepID=UPI001C08DA19|nr:MULTISPECIES: SPOR domain-containing protein [Flavobacteriaceae]MBU2940085.1 SPOR domain-containing protein [Lacinutrix sp. C3R15]MDO6623402.1 SPOR domain-containing protein [Oceanihabitans sp. 1_MG-2023]
MKLLKTKHTLLLSIITFCITSICNAQEGVISINQDEEITRLLELKKEINTNEDANDRYKIQIFSGRRGAAETEQTDFNNEYVQWTSKLVYETPNYKVWVGSFKSRLEADRALLKVKNKFPNAFIFKPKIKKEL